MLLQHGANPRVIHRRQDAILTLNIGAVELLFRYGLGTNEGTFKGHTLLHTMARDNCPMLAPVVHIAMAIGYVDPNTQDKEGWTPILHAIKAGNWEMVETLFPFTDLSLKTNKQETPLHIIAKNKGEHTKKALMKFIGGGIDLEARTNRKYTALGLVTKMADPGLVELMLNAGCNIHTKNCHKRTVLHMAAGVVDGTRKPENMSKICKILIDAGADVNARSDLNLTPINDTTHSCNFLVVRQLLQVNAEVCLFPGFPKSRYSNFMRESILQNAKDCAAYVLQDSLCFSWEYVAPQGAVDLPEDMITQDALSELSSEPEAMVYHEEKEDYETVGLSPLPISLYRMCRVAVRATLPSGPTFPDAVDQLPLAQHVKDFIAFRK